MSFGIIPFAADTFGGLGATATNVTITAVGQSASVTISNSYQVFIFKFIESIFLYK